MNIFQQTTIRCFRSSFRILTEHFRKKTNIIQLQPYLFQKLHKSTSTSSTQMKNIYLLDEIPEDNLKTDRSYCNKFTYRTYNCGELRSNHIGERVTLCGWLEYQRMNKFVVLRDSYGHTQLIIKDEDQQNQSLLKSLPYESIIKVTGTVLSRPKDMINKNQTTGEIEILVESFDVLNKAAEKLPFDLREYTKAKEALRMKYRYIDLRFADMQRNMRVRSEMLMTMRTFLIRECNFVDVETPTLFKATPGGAQEFVVPTRFPGEFYSLVQSPQQFKQMLMAGAIDRYFQIARCYRDEGSRSNRQPEFTQLDIEMSFTDFNGVINLVEELLQYSWPKFLKPLPRLFPRLTYTEAMEKYGTDRPDMRFGFLLKNCTNVLKACDKLTITNTFGAYYITFEEPYSHLTNSLKQKLVRLSQNYSEAKFLQSKIVTIDDWIEKMSKLFGGSVCIDLQNLIEISNNSVLFLAYGNKEQALSLLGEIRLEYIKLLEVEGHKVKNDSMYPVWITDFPLFERRDQSHSLKCAHHPFTAPHPDDVDQLETAPMKVRAQAYDLVLNGNEIAGGSIRIHDPKQQELIFKLLNIEKESMQHVTNMLGSGCPPHGGIALGLDRLLAIILNTQSIRDVIAFPKTFEGRDPISGAPCPITEQDKKLYHIEVLDNASSLK